VSVLEVFASWPSRCCRRRPSYCTRQQRSMEVATNLCNSVKRWHLEADTVLVEKNDWSILFFVRTRMLTKTQRVFVRLRVMLSHLRKRFFFRKNGGLDKDRQFTKTNTKKISFSFSSVFAPP
jgi:hypothetical protein